MQSQSRGRARAAAAWMWAASLVAGGAAWAWSPTGAQATIIVEESLEEMTRGAQAVLLGEVVRVESRWEESGERRLIVTEVVVRVERGVKGVKAGEEVTFWTLGGRAEGLAQQVAGEPMFRVGERAVVFLTRRGEGDERLWVSGMAQGAFRVVEVAAGGEVAVQDTSGLTLAHVKETWSAERAVQEQVATIKGEGAAQVKPLPTLLDEVERLVRAQP
jgi:hypothetical protein